MNKEPILNFINSNTCKSLCWGVLILCLFSLILSNYHFFRQSSTAPKLMTTELSNTHHFREVASLHLFGQDNTLPVADLNIHLVGLMINSEQSQAIIKLPDNSEKIFLTGDTILPGITLKKILPHQVIITSNNQDERLLLPENKLIFSPPPQGL